MKMSPVFAGVALVSLCHAQSDESPVLVLSSDDSFNFDILPGMGQIANDGADTVPSLAVAKKIIPGNWTTYIGAWFELANATKAQAMNQELAYDPINVRATWFSLSDYFRRADAYNREDWDDPRINGGPRR